MAIEHSITFGGVNSADFGIYISGEGVFNAPERDVEMIEIPGRNGELALDKGRFKNIEVTYPAFNYEEDYDTFAQNLSDFRNAICSQIGYQRLSDTFHSDEYRMATFIKGLEIEPIKYNTASKFDLVFNCKPQRWLTSGETAIEVDSGDVVSNPTLFEASPLLEVEGYGTIEFNGFEIELDPAPYGNIEISSLNTKTKAATSTSSNLTLQNTFSFNTSLGNSGDNINCNSVLLTFVYERPTMGTTLVSESSTGSNFSAETALAPGAGLYQIKISLTDIVFSLGTSETKKYNSTVNFVFSSSFQRTADFEVSVIYDGDATMTITAKVDTESGYTFDTWSASSGALRTSPFVLASTKSYLGNATYIDCDLGEAYKYEGGEIVSLNKYIDLGSDLPTLAPGANTITFDNTITDLKVTPRWWRV